MTDTTDDLRAAWSAVADEAIALRDALRDLPVATESEPAHVRAEVERRLPLDAPMPLATVVREAAALLREHAVHVIHPRYFGLYNPQLAVWSHAPAAAELERHALRHLGAALGRAWEAATFTTGGAEANLTAVLA